MEFSYPILFGIAQLFQELSPYTSTQQTYTLRQAWNTWQKQYDIQSRRSLNKNQRGRNRNVNVWVSNTRGQHPFWIRGQHSKIKRKVLLAVSDRSPSLLILFRAWSKIADHCSQQYTSNRRGGDDGRNPEKTARRP